jgi:hypothetical protein
MLLLTSVASPLVCFAMSLGDWEKYQTSDDGGTAAELGLSQQDLVCNLFVVWIVGKNLISFG